MHYEESGQKKKSVKDAERLLKNAHEDAERMIRIAREDAERLLKNAHEDAERMIRIAREDAERLLKNAQEESIQENVKETKQPNQQDESGMSLKKDKLHTVGEMASRLAHDLQNPLTIIKNTVEILKIQQPNLDVKTKDHYEKIERAVTKMTQQIKDVLNYVRTSNLQAEYVSLFSILKSVLNDLKIPDDIKIIFPDEDVMLYGDPKQLEIVFSNLILNSIQAIEKKGKVMIQTSDNEYFTAIDIIDNGHGIEKDNLSHIFEPLFTTKQTGTGLGLASCKAIIENHGGNIDCSSIVGKGTVFTIKLPKTEGIKQ